MDQTKDFDVVMPMYNLTEHGDNYKEKSILTMLQVQPFINYNGVIIDVLHDLDSASLKSKQKMIN